MRVSRRVELLTCIRMFASLWIFEIFIAGVASGAEWAANSSLAFDTNGCEEFGQDARVFPHDVVYSLWKIFYFWAEGMEVSQIMFALPTEEKVADFKRLVEDANPVGVQWDNAALFMEPRPGIRVLFVSNIQNGSYSAIVKINERDEGRDGSHSKTDIRVTSVRMKMAGRVLGIVNCIDHTAFALARLSEMPRTKNECVKAAASLGLNARSGRSYFTVVSAHDEL